MLKSDIAASKRCSLDQQLNMTTTNTVLTQKRFQSLFDTPVIYLEENRKTK